MKILHLISSAGFLGAEQVVLTLATHLRGAGSEVVIGVFENRRNPNLDLASAAKKNNFVVRIFPCRGRYDRNTLLLIREYLEKCRVDILHSHNYKSNFYARMALSHSQARWVVTNHGRRTGPMLFVYNVIDTFIIRRAHKVVAVSDGIAKWLQRAGLEEGKVCVIQNGINLEPFAQAADANATKASLGIDPGALVIGTVGAVTAEKGHVFLLRASKKVLEKFPKAVFLFVGDGKERAQLEKVARRMKLGDSVIFAGMRKDVPSILSILHAFVLPSFREGLPMALLEAQAARVPAIATRVGAIPMVVENGKTGILIPPKDSEAIAHAIIRILENKDTALEMAQRGFEKVRDDFSSESMANRYLSIYRELLPSVN